MRIHNLEIKNIGPFREESIIFIDKDDSLDTPPVIIITGENGTGKSIILDAIRSLFMGIFNMVEREITSSDNFLIKSKLSIEDKIINFESTGKTDKNRFNNNDTEISQLFHSQFNPKYKRDFIFDYWTSKLSNDKFHIDSISGLDSKKYLDEVLFGIHKNIDVTKIISFVDYLKDSKNSSEKNMGETLYSLLEEIINLSINHGVFSHVSRINLNPVIKIGQNEITLNKLSSGNIYIIQRFTNIVKQIYSICILNEIPVSEYKKIKGVILIDEAENHLHPKWQKVFLKNVLKLFPKIQIIVTTHSPFIVSSVENSRVFVCQDNVDHSTISEETDFYANSPIEEILASPLFNTSNFNEEITALLKERKAAILTKDKSKEFEIEQKLLQLNPEYFNYLKINSIIDQLNNEKPN